MKKIAVLFCFLFLAFSVPAHAFRVWTQKTGGSVQLAERNTNTVVIGGMNATNETPQITNGTEAGYWVDGIGLGDSHWGAFPNEYINIQVEKTIDTNTQITGWRIYMTSRPAYADELIMRTAPFPETSGSNIIATPSYSSENLYNNSGWTTGTGWKTLMCSGTGTPAIGDFFQLHFRQTAINGNNFIGVVPYTYEADAEARQNAKMYSYAGTVINPTTFRAVDVIPSDANHVIRGLAVQALGQAPELVWFGDSISVGKQPESYQQTLPQTSESVAAIAPMNEAASACYYVGKALGITYSKMAIGGLSASYAGDYIQQYVIDKHPRYCVVSLGVNDARSNVSVETYISNMTSILNTITNAGIVPIVTAMFEDISTWVLPPWAYDQTTPEQIARRASYRTALKALVESYPTAIYIDSRDAVENVANMPDGVWPDETLKFTTDLLHINAAAHVRWGEDLARQLRIKLSKVPVSLWASRWIKSGKRFRS